MKNWKIFKKWWWYSTGFHLPRLFLEGIKSTIKWLPITWNDKDWDHAYIMKALCFKIKNTADYIEKHKRYENWERDVERMRLCIRLFDALEKDIYELEYQDYYESLFDFEKEERGLSKASETIVKNDLKTYLKKYPNDYRRIEKDTEIRDALRLGSNRHLRATKILFTLIERNIYSWWD